MQRNQEIAVKSKLKKKKTTTLKIKPTMVVPVLRKDGCFKPFAASISFLLHKSKLNPPFGGISIAAFDIFTYCSSKSTRGNNINNQKKLLKS